jgi:Bacterial regulatory protein, Fis family
MSTSSGIGLETTLYRRLLDLSGPEAIEHVLQGVVGMLTRLTGADLAYLEVTGRGQGFQIGDVTGTRDIEAIHARISREILRLVMARLEPISTASALDDERFRELEGVRRNQIRAVLCVPLEPIAGALYLQGPEGFSSIDLERVALCSRQISEQLLRWPLGADRLAFHRATQLFQRHHVRSALERTNWNIAEAARELEVARSYLYKLISTLKLRRFDD